MDLINTPAFALQVNKLLQETHTPGLAVAVVQNNTIASNGFGLATIDPPTNVTADTLFDIASSSKSLTAASVGLLAVNDIDYPHLYWDTPMSYLLPDDFVMSGDVYTNQVSVEDILSHRSGFPRHDFSYLSIRAEHPDTPQSITRNLRNLATAAPIRTKYLYSNIMFIVASWLVESLSGLNFADFLDANFFEPLGMNSTHLQPSAAINAGLQDRMATPYNWDPDNGLRPISFMEVPEAQGCGSILTSANDYAKWVRALMNKESPISDQLYDGLVEPRIKENPEDDDNPNMPEVWSAAGLAVLDVEGYKLIGHDGYSSGFQSFHFFMPELKFGGVVLTNADAYSDILNRVLNLILKAVLGIEDVEDMKRLKRKRDISPSPEEHHYELQQRLCPSRGDNQNTDIVLSAYTGRYCNKGYHCLTVETRGKPQTETSMAQHLFINATDRSNGLTIELDYACNERIFSAHLIDYFTGDGEFVPAEFALVNDRATRLGIVLDDEIEDYIWFDRVFEDTTMTQHQELRSI